MREIKFKAWSKKYKVLADIIISIDFYNGFLTFQALPDHQAIPNHNNFYTDKLENFELIQYTGLKDSKETKEFPDGEPIYEGDILIVGYFALNDSKFGEKPWLNLPKEIHEQDITTELHRFEVTMNPKDLCAVIYHIENNPDVIGIKKIGNKYQNPELLKKVS